MSCEERNLLSVSDDESERQELARHAESCAECAALLEQDRRLAAAVEQWKAGAPEPPARLERRILEALRSAPDSNVARFPGRVASQPTDSGRTRRLWAVAAAAVLAGAGLTLGLMHQLGLPDRDLPDAVRQVRQAERAYTRAIAALEQQAAVRLARADDPDLAPEQAVILLAYRDRLANLDAVIEEVHGFLDDNPGNSGGHTVLLAAYKEKSDLLQEVIHLQMGELS